MIRAIPAIPSADGCRLALWRRSTLVYRYESVRLSEAINHCQLGLQYCRLLSALRPLRNGQ